MNRKNNELAIRVNEIQNLILINKKQYYKLTFQDFNAQIIFKLILKEITKSIKSFNNLKNKN